MKRLIAGLLIALLCLGFAGCSKKEENANSDVTYFDGTSTTTITKDTVVNQVKKGTMTIEYEGGAEDNMVTTEIALKMSSEELTKCFEEGAVTSDTRGDYIRYICGGTQMYYTNDERTNGLASIVYPGTGFGFEPYVTTKDQIVSVMGKAAAEGKAPEEAVTMFLMHDNTATYLDYDCGENCISFFFHENKLSMIVMYQKGLWIY